MSLLPRTLSRRRRRSGASAISIIASFILAAASLSVSVISGPAARAATCGTTNIALHQPTTASSIQGPAWPASNATDGNLSTRWSSAFSDPQWLEVDLGSTQSICQVVIHWETAYATAFQIQTSSDASTGRRSTRQRQGPAAPRRSPSAAAAGTSGCTAPPAPPCTDTPSWSSRSTGGDGAPGTRSRSPPRAARPPP